MGKNRGYLPNVYLEITRNLDVLVEINTDYKPCLKMFSLEKVKVNAEALHYCYYMILLKVFLLDNFPDLTHTASATVTKPYCDSNSWSVDSQYSQQTVVSMVVLMVVVMVSRQAMVSIVSILSRQTMVTKVTVDAQPADNTLARVNTTMRLKKEQHKPSTHSALGDVKQADSVLDFMYYLKLAAKHCTTCHNIFSNVYHIDVTNDVHNQNLLKELNADPPVFRNDMEYVWSDITPFPRNTMSCTLQVIC